MTTALAGRISQAATLLPTGPVGGAAKTTAMSQVVALVTYAPPPARSARVSQMLGLVPYAVGANQAKIPRVSQFLQLVVWASEIPSEDRSRAWAFVLDGHPMYVLDLGDEGTYIYDLVTQQWSNFITKGHTGWNMRNGTMWGEINRIVGADTSFPYVWELTPDEPLDEGFRQIDHVVTGGIMLRSRVFVSMAALRVAASSGKVQGNIITDFNMRFSDDQGNTWSKYYPVQLTPDDFKQDIAWRSLGSFMAPGRLIELSDTGGLIRIDGADVFINNFDMENPEEQAPPTGGANGR